MAWPAVALALGALAAGAAMAILSVPIGTIEIIMGVVVTPLMLAFVAVQVGQQAGTLQSVKDQTNGTQSAMVQAMADQGAALTALVHHLATNGTIPPAPPPPAPPAPALPYPPVTTG